jgi:hypothetical protein
VPTAGPSATSTLALEARATQWYQWGMRKTSPPFRTGKSVHVRVPDRQLTLIKKWIAKQPEPKPSLPQAILRLAGIALASEIRRMTMSESVPNNPQRRAFDRGLRDGRSGDGRKPQEGESLRQRYNDGYMVGSSGACLRRCGKLAGQPNR